MREEGVSDLLKTVLESQYYTENYLCYVHLTWTDLESYSGTITQLSIKQLVLLFNLHADSFQVNRLGV